MEKRIIAYKCNQCGFTVDPSQIDKIRNAKPLQRIISDALCHFHKSHTITMNLSDWLPIYQGEELTNELY